MNLTITQVADCNSNNTNFENSFEDLALKHDVYSNMLKAPPILQREI